MCQQELQLFGMQGGHRACLRQYRAVQLRNLQQGVRLTVDDDVNWRRQIGREV